MKRTPAEIATMDPQTAWNDGYRTSREELAEGLGRDATAAGAMQSIEAKLDLDNRLTGLERSVKLLADNDFDKANVLVDHGRRLVKLEGGKVGPPADDDTGMDRR